jgi:SNF2 family DNA or RNA helicase
MQVLHQMLKRLTNEGHKTLIFSQFTTVLDLIGASLELKGKSQAKPNIGG